MVSAGPFALGLPALLKALAFPLRVIAYLGLFGALPAWIDEAGAARAAEELLAPLRRLGMRPEVASQAIAVALGFIPILARMRGTDMAMWARREGAVGIRHAWPGAPIPPLARCPDRTGRLALAMEARGFGSASRSAEREPLDARGRAFLIAGLTLASFSGLSLAFNPTAFLLCALV